MTEREMEDLIWEHPERFSNEPLQKFERQSVSRIGRPDPIITDRIGRLLVIELKLGILQRDAISQVIDYLGVLKERFPDRRHCHVAVKKSYLGATAVSVRDMAEDHRSLKLPLATGFSHQFLLSRGTHCAQAIPLQRNVTAPGKRLR